MSATWLRWQEWVGFVAFAFNLAGNEMLTSKNRRGWGVRIWSNVAQLAYAVLVWSPYLILNSVTFGVVNVRGLVKWRRMDQGHAATCALVHPYTMGNGSAIRIVCNCGRLA